MHSGLPLSLRAAKKKLTVLPNLLGIAALMFLSLVHLAGCGISPPPDIRPTTANTVSLDPADWYIFYSSEMPSHPSTDLTGAWCFEFPGIGGHVNYVQTPFNATTILYGITLTFKVESDAPQYRVTDPSDKPPATVHLFFEQQNDDLRNPGGRWWAFASDYNLGSHDNAYVTLTVPLTPEVWSNVYGQHDEVSFYSAVANIGWIGITFGGQDFWGHGVALNSGSAKYILIDFKVT